ELLEPVRDRGGGGDSGRSGRIPKRRPMREVRRQGRGMRAPGAVRRPPRPPLDRDQELALVVEEEVARLVAVAAGDNDRARAELADPLGQVAPRAVEAGQRL